MKQFSIVILSFLVGITLAPLCYAAPDVQSQVMTYLNDPNIIYLLIILGIYGVFFEFTNPGMFAPGIIGIMALVLALYGMNSLPVNYAGLSLILIGITFILLEFIIFSYGALGIGGVIAFVLGSAMLFDTADPQYQLSWQIIAAMTVVSVVFFFVIVTMVIRAHKKKVTTGKEGLIGKSGVVVSVMNEQIIVRVLGELWEARSGETVQIGDTVKVARVKDLMLTVNKETKAPTKSV